MHSRKSTKVVAIEGGCVGDAGVSQQQRKYGGKCGPDDQGGDGAAGPVAVNALHENRDDVVVLRAALPGHFTPGNHAEHADVHHDVDGSDRDDGDDEGARDGAAGIFHLATQEAHVVITPIVVGGD